ncbi:unnamed protein product [Darwinula stevensoni]|uniref:C-type lectin domain-containing protein n=1 Tax=Darwinula stevensoni TaxID=69355 RepID=A0A7R8XFE3_9CRUS|nr:unnamed protein product [Darwinula stevensoni]CAG0891519.1 unnamed protein product [Darwinula stevensoni]
MSGVHFLVLLFHASRESVKGVIIQGKYYDLLPEVTNASILSPLKEASVERPLLCAALCKRYARTLGAPVRIPASAFLSPAFDFRSILLDSERDPVCSIYTVGMEGGDELTCRLGGPNSQVGAAVGTTSKLYLNSARVPQDYVFGMVTSGKIYFLKKLLANYNYTNAKAACEAGGGQLAMDNRGDDWHNYIKAYITVHYWIGGDDLNPSLIYTWRDGSLMSQPKSYWCTSQPDRHNHCASMRGAPANTTDTSQLCWDDVACASQIPSLCEIGIP